MYYTNLITFMLRRSDNVSVKIEKKTNASEVNDSQHTHSFTLQTITGRLGFSMPLTSIGGKSLKTQGHHSLIKIKSPTFSTKKNIP